MLRLVAALVLALSTLQTASASTLDRVRQTGVFKIGYRADAPPYSFRNDRGQAAGLIVDLCREVATAVTATMKGAAVRVDYVLVPATSRFEAVRDRQIDILCDPSSITLARRELVDFSIPTFLDGASVLSRNERPVRRFEDMKDSRIGVLGGTTTEKTLRASLDDLGVAAEIVVAPDHQSGMDMLTSNKVDAYFADRAIIAALLHQRRLSGFRLSQQYFSYETYALALPREDSQFRLLVDRTLARLYRSGRINTLFARAFGQEPQDEILKAFILINSLPEK